MWDYSETLKDHYMNPRNVGKLEDANGTGEVGSLACGDALTLYIKVSDDGIVEDTSFQTFGCGSAVASASALTEMIKGKPLAEVEKVTNQDIADFLGGIPKEKMHCSVMGSEALEAAIAHYRGEEPRQHDEGEVICMCFGVTDTEIKRVVKENHLKTIEEVTNYTKAGGGCGGCLDKIQELIDEVLASETVEEREKKPLTNLQKIKLIEETINREIRPSLQADGGDIELVDVDGNRVIVALRGACARCPSSEYTLAGLVESKLREFVDPALTLEEVE
jgi:NifU-like protein